MAYKYIIYDKADGIATITINKPEKMNAISFIGPGEDWKEICTALDDAAEDDDIKVVIMKGSGRAFCVGHDMTKVGFVYGFGEGKTKDEKRPSQRVRLKMDDRMFSDFLNKIFLHPKLTIAQVHGHCLAGGMILMVQFDMAIVAEDARIGQVEQRYGFAGHGFPTLPIMIHHVGLRRARELVLTGRVISGKKAADIGLATLAVPPDELEKATMDIARGLALLPADGIAIGKAMNRMVYDNLGLTAGFGQGTVGHTFFTNLQYKEGEWNFYRERREKGAREAFHDKDELFGRMFEAFDKYDT
ncbi:enoyl-CoA hydratase-related protein [Chloroflexota bacterium]